MAIESPINPDSPTIGWWTMLRRLLVIGGLTAIAGGIVGEIYFVTDDVPIHVMVAGPPEEQLVHGLSVGAIFGGAFAALLGGIAWLASANSQSFATAWRTFLAALGPVGGHYDGRDKPQQEIKTDTTSEWPSDNNLN